MYVNGTQQVVQFSGLAPNQGGLYQINFILSRDTPVRLEGENQIWLDMNGVESPRLTISLAGTAQ